MIMYASLCPDVTSDTDRLFKNGTALLEKKREMSEFYRDSCLSMAGRSDGTP